MSYDSPSSKVYVDWGKLAQITLIVGSTVALALGKVIEEATISLILGAAAGYIFGNGKSAREGTTPAPLIGRRPVDDQTWHLEPSPEADGGDSV